MKKHISDTTPAQAAAHEVTLAKKKAQLEAAAHKEQELVLEADVVDSVEARDPEIRGLDEYINQGHQMIQKGQLKITAQSWLAAVKIRTDQRSKQKSNKTEYLKTIYAIASGAKKESETTNGRTETGTSAGTTPEMDKRGAHQPDDIYHQAAGAGPA